MRALKSIHKLTATAARARWDASPRRQAIKNRLIPHAKSNASAPAIRALICMSDGDGAHPNRPEVRSFYALVIADRRSPCCRSDARHPNRTAVFYFRIDGFGLAHKSSHSDSFSIPLYYFVTKWQDIRQPLVRTVSLSAVDAVRACNFQIERAERLSAR